MSDPQPEATTTAARVLSDAEIAELGVFHARMCRSCTPRHECTEKALMNMLDAAHTRAVEAERERDEWRARWNLENVARQDAVLARQQAESIAHSALGEVDRLERERAEARTERARAAEHMAGYARQAERERLMDKMASQQDALNQRIREADSDRAVAWQIAQDRGQRAERAEAALTTEQEERDELHADYMAALAVLELTRNALAAASSQAAPHEPTQQGEG